MKVVPRACSERAEALRREALSTQQKRRSAPVQAQRQNRPRPTARTAAAGGRSALSVREARTSSPHLHCKCHTVLLGSGF